MCRRARARRPPVPHLQGRPRRADHPERRRLGDARPGRFRRLVTGARPGGSGMTGPEHYREAERYLSVLNLNKASQAWLDAIKSGELDTAIAAAQVHATL